MRNLFGLLTSAFVILVTQSAVAADMHSPVGLWKTIDDITGKPKAIVEITETPSHTLQGTVIKIFPRPGYDQNELCTACRGSRHNQRIVGMTILNGLRADRDNPGRWDDGEILDPKNGKTYHSAIQLTDHNQKLNVRGYIGIPLFGRSQIWNRVTSKED